MIRACGGQLSDYDQLDGTVAHSACDLNARHTGTIFSVLGHMHEFGKAYRMTLHPDTPDEIESPRHSGVELRVAAQLHAG
jgi:hypothetical protein